LVVINTLVCSYIRLRRGASLRSQLVGKFPEIQHQPAPKDARLLLSEEDRNNLLAGMVLV
jgi:hypothetical protein